MLRILIFMLFGRLKRSLGRGKKQKWTKLRANEKRLQITFAAVSFKITLPFKINDYTLSR